MEGEVSCVVSFFACMHGVENSRLEERNRGSFLRRFPRLLGRYDNDL